MVRKALKVVLAASAVAVAGCGGGSTSGNSGTGKPAPGNTGGTTSACDNIDGAYVFSPSTPTSSSSTCTKIANASAANDSLVYTLSTSGDAITVSQPGKASLQGTLDRSTCKGTVSTSLTSDGVDARGAPVTVTVAEQASISFAGNSSVAVQNTVNVSASANEPGLPCTLTGSNTGTKSAPASCTQSLFQSWTVKSFTPSVSGAVAVSPINLGGVHYGPAQSFSIFGSDGSQCTYSMDIERTTTGIPETGTVRLTNPSPASVECVENAGTVTYKLNCSELTVTDPTGVAVYGTP